MALGIRIRTIFQIVYVLASLSSILVLYRVSLEATTLTKTPVQHRMNKVSTIKLSNPKNHVHIVHNSSVHIWNNLCEKTIKGIRYHPLFPMFPNLRKRKSCLRLQANQSDLGDDYALRQFGFLTPRSSGNFTFAVYSDDSSEFWLSTDEQPSNLKMIARVGEEEQVGWTLERDIGKYKSQISTEIAMEKGKNYFFELLFKQIKILDHYGVLWKPPGSDVFVDVPCSAVHGYAPREEHRANLNNAAHFHQSAASKEAQRQKEFLRFFALPFVPDNVVENALPKCNNTLAYKGTAHLNRFDGVYVKDVYEVLTEIYPADESGKFIMEGCEELGRIGGAFDCSGNRLIDKRKVLRVTKLLLKAIEDKLGRREYSLKRIHLAENHPFAGAGDRFLLDLEVQNSRNKSYRLSEYVLYRPNRTSPLCFPSNYSWNKNATVNIISTAGHQHGWVEHLIKSVARIQNITKDENINFILMDYGNGESDLQEVMRKSGIKRGVVVKMKGIFHKTKAIQDATALVKDPNEIIFQLDLHLDLPLNLVDYVRQHCVLGKMAVTPILLRLNCDSTPIQPSGFWDTEGYGLYAIYKKDWQGIGGMDVENFNGSWGGEDWDLCDKTLIKGYEIERRRLVGLFHHFHAHKHLWDGSKKD